MLFGGQLSGFSQTVFPFKVYQVLVRYGEVGLAQAAVYVQLLKLRLCLSIYIFWENKFAYHFKEEKSQVAIWNLVLISMSDFQFVP